MIVKTTTTQWIYEQNGTIYPRQITRYFVVISRLKKPHTITWSMFGRACRRPTDRSSSFQLLWTTADVEAWTGWSTDTSPNKCRVGGKFSLARIRKVSSTGNLFPYRSFLKTVALVGHVVISLPTNITVIEWCYLPPGRVAGIIDTYVIYVLKCEEEVYIYPARVSMADGMENKCKLLSVAGKASGYLGKFLTESQFHLFWLDPSVRSPLPLPPPPDLIVFCCTSLHCNCVPLPDSEKSLFLASALYLHLTGDNLFRPCCSKIAIAIIYSSALLSTWLVDN